MSTPAPSRKRSASVPPPADSRPCKALKQVAAVTSISEDVGTGTATNGKLATKEHSGEASKNNGQMSEGALDEESAETLAQIALAPCTFSQNDMVTLLVGPDQHKMIVQTHFITRDSEYFAAALKKAWSEGQTRVVNLPEQCPKIMAHYLALVHGEKLPTSHITDVWAEESDQSEYTLLAYLYVYGERFLNRRVQCVVPREIDRLTHVPIEEQPSEEGQPSEGGHVWHPSTGVINVIYRGTPVGSPARRYMVDMFLAHGAEDWMDGDLDLDFTADLLKGFYREKYVVDHISDIPVDHLQIDGYLCELHGFEGI